jgi:glycoside/pentoside/hexuronide:cation symporter, GPH family
MIVSQARPKRMIALASASLNGFKQLYWSFFSILGLVYLTDIVGLNPVLAGGIIFASLIFDALADLPVGAFLDGVRARISDYGAILYWSAGLSSLFLAGFFGLSAVLATQAASVWLIVPVLFAFRLCFSVFDLAENSIAARVMTDPQARTYFAAGRKIAACLATMSLGAGVGWLLAADSDQAQRLAMTACLGGAALFGLIALTYRALRSWDQSGPPLVRSTIGERLNALRQTPAGWSITGISLLEAASTTVFVSGLIYYAKAVYGDPAWAGHGIIAFTLAQIIGQPVWLWCAHRFGKVVAFAATHGATAVCAAAFLLFADQDRTSGLVIVFCIGLAIGGVSTLRWSIIPDIIDAAAITNRVRVESGLIGLVIAGIQIGAGLSSGVLGAGLSVIGYLPSAPQVVSQSIGVVVALPIIVLHVVCAILILLGAKLWPLHMSQAQPL